MEQQIVLSTKQVTDFFGITRNTLSKWSKAGCPQVARGKWDLKQVFDWWWQEIASEKAAQESGDESMSEARRLYWWEKYQGEKIDNEQRRGRLIPKENVVREWAFRVAQVTEGLSAFAKRLPPLLEGKSQKEIQQILEDEAWKLRDNFCRTGQFCPAEAAREALEVSGGESQPTKKQAQGKKKTRSKSRTGQKTRSTASTRQSRYGKTTSTRGKGKKGKKEE